MGLPFVDHITYYANANSIVFQGAASNTDGYYVGNTVSIATGDGIGVTSTIVAYNGAGRVATVSPNWNVNLSDPDENFYYNIGNYVTNINGDLAGVFIIPSYSGAQFPTGTSVFMLSDSSLGNVATASTKAQDTYTAQGTLETTQQQYVTTRVPVVTTQIVSQTQTVVSDVTTNSVISGSTQYFAYFDPLAQTFLVDATIYPDGVFITSVRVCFFSADASLPVTLQIRPVSNGYPDSGIVIPFSEVILPASKVNVTTAPSLDVSRTIHRIYF